MLGWVKITGGREQIKDSTPIDIADIKIMTITTALMTIIVATQVIRVRALRTKPFKKKRHYCTSLKKPVIFASQDKTTAVGRRKKARAIERAEDEDSNSLN
jgi:hypothetical protein